MKKQLSFLFAILMMLSAIPVSAVPASEKLPVETVIQTMEGAKPESVPTDPYAAPPKIPETYDPKDTRVLKIHGAAQSDGNWCVLYGECALGTTVKAKNSKGTYSAVSEGGCFALRFLNSDTETANLLVYQTANGKQVGQGIRWQGEIARQTNTTDWGVFIGKDNQGFFTKMLPDFTHTNLLDKTTLQNVKKRYTDRVEKLATVGDGCELVMILVPSSMTVYPELVPEEVAKPGTGDSRFDQVKKALTEAGVTVLDMRTTFENHKNDSLPLYFHYDSHWTDYGAYLAYVELYQYIAERYPDAAPRTFDKFTWERSYHTRGDITWYFGLDKGGLVYEHTVLRRMKFTPIKAVADMVRYPDEDWSLSYPCFSREITGGGTYHTNRSRLPDIMMIRNSFGAYKVDLLVERSDSSYIMPSFSYAFNFAQIQKNDPDYLVYVMCEWEFDNIINN